MTNFENLHSMTIDQLIDWLDKNGQLDTAIWTLWFDKKYCSKCGSIVCHYEDSTREFPCAWCELNGSCKFFPELKSVPNNKEVINLWLKSEVKNNAQL